MQGPLILTILRIPCIHVKKYCFPAALPGGTTLPGKDPGYLTNLAKARWVNEPFFRFYSGTLF